MSTDDAIVVDGDKVSKDATDDATETVAESEQKKKHHHRHHHKKHHKHQERDEETSNEKAETEHRTKRKRTEDADAPGEPDAKVPKHAHGTEDGNESELDPDEVAREGRRLRRDAARNGTSEKHQLHDVAAVAKGKRTLPERESKLAAKRAVTAYCESGLEEYMDLDDEAARRRMLEDLTDAIAFAGKVLTVSPIQKGVPDDTRRSFARLMAWIVCYKDVAGAALGTSTQPVPAKFAGDETLRNARAILDAFKRPCRDAMESLCQLLCACWNMEKEQFDHQYVVIGSVNEAVAPPVVVLGPAQSDGKMVCDFNRHAIPAGEYPYVLTMECEGITKTRSTRTFVLMQRSKDMVCNLYDFWYWPKVLQKTLEKIYEGMCGRGISAEDAMTEVTQVALSDAVWTRFENGRMVAFGLLKYCHKKAIEVRELCEKGDRDEPVPPADPGRSQQPDVPAAAPRNASEI